MKNNLLRRCMKICGFFIIANLPFLTINQLVGVDTFIESFNHPDSFMYIKNELAPGTNINGEYLILKKPSAQGWSIGEGDQILYYSIKDSLQQNIVYQIRSTNGITTYYTIACGADTYDGPIYEHQIIGKIIGNSKDTIWNSLCLQLWKLSIDHLNIMTFFSQI